MAKRPRKTSAPAVICDRAIAGIEMEAVYYVPELQPSARGSWNGEPGKFAWTDPATGLPCIIRREAQGGHLSGFVGLRSGHPLFGFAADAIPSHVAHAHGGLNYAQPCDETGPEDRSVCHVHTDGVQGHDDRWWIGFSCNRINDLVPDDHTHAAEAQRLGIDQTYRPPEYVFHECAYLAGQMAALEQEVR